MSVCFPIVEPVTDALYGAMVVGADEDPVAIKVDLADAGAPWGHAYVEGEARGCGSRKVGTILRRNDVDAGWLPGCAGRRTDVFGGYRPIGPIRAQHFGGQRIDVATMEKGHPDLLDCKVARYVIGPKVSHHVVGPLVRELAVDPRADDAVLLARSVDLDVLVDPVNPSRSRAARETRGRSMAGAKP
jgi:hypothetical protein